MPNAASIARFTTPFAASDMTSSMPSGIIVSAMLFTKLSGFALIFRMTHSPPTASEAYSIAPRVRPSASAPALEYPFSLLSAMDREAASELISAEPRMFVAFISVSPVSPTASPMPLATSAFIALSAALIAVLYTKLPTFPPIPGFVSSMCFEVSARRSCVMLLACRHLE